jgi:CheY-like chemotaxis protein
MTEEKLVLYADNDPDDRELLEDAFGHVSGYKLLIFTGSEEILAFLRAEPPGVSFVILDHNMPFLTGRQVLQKIREEIPGASYPVFIFSTTVSPDEEVRIRQLNGVAIKKPLSYNEVKEAVETFILLAQAQQGS